MTVNSTAPIVRYTGNGVTANFAVPFQFFTVLVYADGVLKTAGIDYTLVGGDGATGEVDFIIVPNAGAKVVIIGGEALDQTSNLTDFDDAPSEVYEDALDKLTMLVKNLSELQTRSVRTTADAPALSTMAVPLDKNGIIKFENGVPSFFEITSFAPLVGPQGPPGPAGIGDSLQIALTAQVYN